MGSANSPLLKKVMINDIDVSNYIKSYEVKKEYNLTIGTATIVLNRNVSTILTVDDTLNNKSVTIQRGVNDPTEVYIFRGEVIQTSLSGGEYTVTCNDKYYEAQRTQLTTSFDISVKRIRGEL